MSCWYCPYRFFSLPLVGLHFELQLVNQVLQPVDVFLVLLSLIVSFKKLKNILDLNMLFVAC